MFPAPDWRKDLSATTRFENIQNIQKGIESAGETLKEKAQQAAFAAETEAYKDSHSLEAYEAVCNALSSSQNKDIADEPVFPSPTNGTGISIGKYQNCHHIADGLISDVYRSEKVALKVITDTRNAEPHNPTLEVAILKQLSHPNIITLIETFRDQENHLSMVFPYMPLTLETLLQSKRNSLTNILPIFKDLFSALSYIHSLGIIHRDIKPSNLLLSSPTGPAHLCDFGTAWHPSLSPLSERATHKVLEVGTTCYRAPETLFGNRAYGTSLDIWAAGTMLAECLRDPPKPLFESRRGDEDGNQLGLILSMFKTFGTPTKESWPEAEGFGTPPFEWYTEFPGKGWEELLPGVREDLKKIVESMVVYESGKRATAEELLGIWPEK